MPIPEEPFQNQSPTSCLKEFHHIMVMHVFMTMNILQKYFKDDDFKIPCSQKNVIATAGVNIIPYREPSLLGFEQFWNLQFITFYGKFWISTKALRNHF